MINQHIWATITLIPLLTVTSHTSATGVGAQLVSKMTSTHSAHRKIGSEIQPTDGGSGSRPSGTTTPKTAPSNPEGFTRIQRSGSVDIENEYDLTGLSVPMEQIHTLLPRDAIPALTNPKTELAETARWLTDDARVIEIVIGEDVLGVPLRILDWHEVVNTIINGEPIAATYCPLCDSATVFSRRITPDASTDHNSDGSGTKPSSTPKPSVLEFGVSGALYNSNVLMYDKQGMGLWSQLGMRALSGPHAGMTLKMLPIEVVTFAEFKKAHPGAKIVSKDTGFERDYTNSPYESYFKDEKLMVPVAGVGESLPRKTLGLGIAIGEYPKIQSWFVPAKEIKGTGTIETPEGPVVYSKNEAGIVVISMPQGVRTAQTFYYSWSAFYPEAEVVHPTE